MTTELSKKTCVPCRGGVPPLPAEKAAEYLRQIDGWSLVRNHHISKEFKFPDFVQALEAVNRIGALAEREGHHPDIYLAWGKLRLEIWTHKIDGLTESDFILAAKMDEIL
jgi:4a-hydroxytetrahydrobiopterin dehydratase